jgi:branched-chain amino acid transport system ATP-binding protein
VSAPLLQVSHVTARYGVLPVLHDVSLDIHQREIVALIGANGAGKTTLMMTIFGRPPQPRRILFEGRNITELPAHAIARLGIAQSPEGGASSRA